MPGRSTGSRSGGGRSMGSSSGPKRTGGGGAKKTPQSSSGRSVERSKPSQRSSAGRRLGGNEEAAEEAKRARLEEERRRKEERREEKRQEQRWREEERREKMYREEQPPMHHNHEVPPKPQHDNTYRARRPREEAPGYGSKSGCGCFGTVGKVLLGIFVICVIISAITGGSSEEKDKKHTEDKTQQTQAAVVTPKGIGNSAETVEVMGALPEGSVTETDYYQDDIQWIVDEDVFTDGLKYFYQKTGIQPFVQLTDSIGIEEPTDEEIEQYCNDQYDERFTDEGHLFFVYITSEYDDGLMWAVCGKDASKIIDDKAWDVLFDNIEECYNATDTYSDDEIFGEGFRKTADQLMKDAKENTVEEKSSEPAVTNETVVGEETVSKDTKDKEAVSTAATAVEEKDDLSTADYVLGVFFLFFLIAIPVGGVVVIVLIVTDRKKKKEAQKQQSENDLEKVLNVPLEKFSDQETADEMQSLMDKYDGKEDGKIE